MDFATSLKFAHVLAAVLWVGGGFTTIIAGIVRMATEMGVLVLAEGIETVEDMDALLALGVQLQQGYFFARPSLETFVEEADIEALRAAA